MTESDSRDVRPGDRVTLVDPDGSGEEFEGVVSKAWESGCINALYRPDGDGGFAEGETPEYTIATSLTLGDAEAGDATHAFRPGWTTEAEP